MYRSFSVINDNNDAKSRSLMTLLQILRMVIKNIINDPINQRYQFDGFKAKSIELITEETSIFVFLL